MVKYAFQGHGTGYSCIFKANELNNELFIGLLMDDKPDRKWKENGYGSVSELRPIPFDTRNRKLYSAKEALQILIKQECKNKFLINEVATEYLKDEGQLQ